MLCWFKERSEMICCSRVFEVNSGLWPRQFLAKYNDISSTSKIALRAFTFRTVEQANRPSQNAICPTVQMFLVAAYNQRKINTKR